MPEETTKKVIMTVYEKWALVLSVIAILIPIAGRNVNFIYAQFLTVAARQDPLLPVAASPDGCSYPEKGLTK